MTEQDTEALPKKKRFGWLHVLGIAFIALIVIAVMSLFTAFHRLFHVWRMTGGEEGGWAPAKEPFVATAPSVQEAGDPGEVA